MWSCALFLWCVHFYLFILLLFVLPGDDGYAIFKLWRLHDLWFDLPFYCWNVLLLNLISIESLVKIFHIIHRFHIPCLFVLRSLTTVWTPFRVSPPNWGSWIYDHYFLRRRLAVSSQESKIRVKWPLDILSDKDVVETFRRSRRDSERWPLYKQYNANVHNIVYHLRYFYSVSLCFEQRIQTL